jgi:hypothetical protein
MISGQPFNGELPFALGKALGGCWEVREEER